MDFCADVMSDEADNTLAIGSQHCRAGIGEALGKTVDPETAVWIQHHLDDSRVFKESGDVRPERRTQHAGTARDRFCLGSCVPHFAPGAASASRVGPDIGDE